HGDAEVFERSLLAFRQRHFHEPAVVRIGTGHDVEREIEVLRGSCERADDGNVARGYDARQSLPPRADESVRRLVPEHSAIVRGIAARGADVAARLDACDPRGEL